MIDSRDLIGWFVSYRRTERMTQAEVAAALGVDQKTVSNWERALKGEADLKPLLPETRVKLCRFWVEHSGNADREWMGYPVTTPFMRELACRLHASGGVAGILGAPNLLDVVAIIYREEMNATPPNFAHLHEIDALRDHILRMQHGERETLASTVAD